MKLFLQRMVLFLLAAMPCVAQVPADMLDTARSAYQTGHPSEASRVLSEVLRDLPTESPEADSLRAVTLQLRGWCAEDLGRRDEALADYKRCIDLRTRLFPAGHPERGGALMDEGNLLYAMGRYVEAESLIPGLLHELRVSEGEEGENTLTWLGNLGMLQYKNGKYGEAEITLLEVMRRSGPLYGTTEPPYILALNNLAGLYMSMGRYKEAEDRYLEVLRADSVRAIHDSRRNIVIVNNLAHLYKKTGRWDDAERYYLHALDLHRLQGTDSSQSAATVMNNLAMLYMEAGRYRDAEPLFTRSRDIDRALLGPGHPSYANDLNNLGSWNWRMGNTTEAERLYREAMNIRREILGDKNPDFVTYLGNLAMLYTAMNRLEEAEPLHLRMVRTLLEFLEMNFPALSEKEKTDYAARLRHNLNSFNAFAVRRIATRPGIAADMYDLQLAIKGILFRNTRRVRERILASSDTALIASFRRWEQMKLQTVGLLRLRQRAREQLGLNVDSILQACNRAERTLCLASEEFKDVYGQDRPDWTRIRDRLRLGEAAIEILRYEVYDTAWTERVAYAALICTPDCRDAPILVHIPDAEKLEDYLLSYYRSCMRKDARDVVLYRRFWAPLDQALKGIDRVYLSGDGVYYLINPLTLPHPGGGFLLDSLDIRLVTSTADIATLQSNTRSEKTALLLGFPAYGNGSTIPPLPGTKDEVQMIAALLRADGYHCRELLGRDASEDTLLKAAHPGILHIATHGYFVDRNRGSSNDASMIPGGYTDDDVQRFPLLRSGLLLAGASTASAPQLPASSGSDGVLTASEAMHLDLQSTRLVVLSACNTGLGTVRIGEGVYGLQRAMLVAGAQAVLMSLWPVSDRATTVLMTAFYERYLASGDVDAAYRSAQQQIRKQWNTPTIWGAFVLVR